MKFSRFLSAGLIALSALGVVPSASAWVQGGGNSTWPDGTVPVVFMFGTSPTLSDGLTWNVNAQWALEQWNLYTPRTQLTFSTSSSTLGADGNGINEMYFSPTEDGDTWGTNTLAVTLSWYVGTRRVQSDIQFNSTLTWDSYRGGLRYSGTKSVPEFRRVALHELGHLIGLGHPDGAGQSVSAVMNSTMSNIETLQNDDKVGAGTLYSIPTAPVISTHPVSRTVYEGDSTTMSVSAAGGTLTYQWRKDGTNLSGATSSTYSVTSAKPSDTGDYTVVVSNSVGSVTSNVAKLTVSPPPPPSMPSGPWGTAMTEGTDAELSVFTSGSGLSYQWRRDGVNIAGANQAVLRFRPARLWDAGSYDVVISNSGGSVTSYKAVVTVGAARPLAIQFVPGSGSFLVGESLSINVGVAATGSYTSVWKRDGVVVANQPGSSLSIYPAKASDAGTYELTVSNASGTYSSGPIVMTVRAPAAPVLLSRPREISIEEGGSYYTSLSVSGTPTPTYSWTKDGVTLPGWTAPYFSVSNASSVHAGMYTITATNSAGSTSHSFQATVVPRSGTLYFNRSPGSQRLSAGAYVTVSSQVNDSTGVTYRWFKDNVEIPNSNNSYYTILSFSASYEGTYAVEATNGTKTIRSADAQLALRGAANVFEILQQPTSGAVLDGSPDGFGVSINSGPSGSLAYQWYRDGVAVSGATSYSLYKAWTLADTGDYTVKITQGAETLTSQVARIQVMARPLPVIVAQPFDQTLNIGETAYFSVNGRWANSFTWKKGSTVLQTSPGDTYVVNPATASTAGEYSVVLTNSTGSVESTKATITVLPGKGPEITRQPARVKSSGGYNNLDVQAIGTQPLSYQWKKNNVALPGFTSSSISLGTVTPGLAGNYTVVVSNAYGSIESQAGVVEYDGAYGSPVVTQHPLNSSAVIGQTASLTASAWGSPSPSIQWRRNGVNISGATQWKLDLTNAQTSDSGSYDAVITNSNGSVTTQAATLTIGIDNGRIVALAARAQVGTGSDVLIPGFFVGGSVPKKLLIRALGPTLTSYGVQGALADPTLEVKALGSSTVIASNDDWTGAGADPTLATVFAQVGASALSSGSKDAAVIATLAPGLYTAVTAGKNGGTGVALMEVFDVDPAAGKLTGISTRAVVGTGSNVLIPGIVVEGPIAKKLLIRVSGPALAAFGVTGTLKDPKLELKNSGGTTIQSSDNWDKTDNAITGAVTTIGLTPFADGSKDSAIVANLSAGLYTIIISGADGGSGVALVEVYEVP